MNYRGDAKQLIKHIQSEIKGKDEQIEKAVITLLAKGHLLIEDVPGVGKTTLAKSLAYSTHCSFNRIQFTPDTLPSDVIGVSIYNMQTGKFEFSEGAIMNQIVLADEINRTSPKTQASLLEAMEERQVTVDGKTYELKEPFMVIATQNPVDYLGTYHLPEAQLDRFMIKISMGYPSPEAEKEMVWHKMTAQTMKKLDAILSGEDICKMQQEVGQVEINKELIEYIVTLINATRTHTSLSLGASPRATLALVKASQARAYIEGRDYVIPDDIIRMIEPVLGHRIILSTEAKMNKQTPEKILQEIIGKTKIPIF